MGLEVDWEMAVCDMQLLSQANAAPSPAAPLHPVLGAGDDQPAVFGELVLLLRRVTPATKCDRVSV
jgi:hypothetical protein